MERTPGQKLWKRLITELLDKDIYFDLVNNVLTFKGLPDDTKGLWLWFGEIRVAMEGETTAGKMLILNEYELNEDNELIVHTAGTESE